MKINYYLINLLIILTLYSCAHKQIEPETPLKDDYGNELFAKAENYYQSDNFSRAQKYYQKYIESYPDGQMATAALFKMGSIETLTGNYDNARTIFSDLIRMHPDSYFVPEAHIEILMTYFREKKYSEVIDRSKTLSESLPEN